MVALASALSVVALPAPQATAATRVLYVSPGGDDVLVGGSQAEPFRTLKFAIRHLVPGDTLIVSGGTYREVAGWGTDPATPEQPILVQAAPGERVVLKGVLHVAGASYWTFDGINVTRDPDRPKDQYLVKLVDGVGWKFINAEVWGTRGVSNVMINGTKAGEPRDWRFVGNCVHGVGDGPHFMNYHNMYLTPGVRSGSGFIARNLFFDVANGNHIKAAGPDASTGGAANVRIAYNTMVRAGQGVVVAYRSHHIDLERNLITNRVGGSAWYPAIRGYSVSGAGNVAKANAAWGYDDALRSTYGNRVIRNAGGNRLLNPRFASTGGCDDYRPTNPAAAAYGHLAP
jgi:hypothetical protein